MKRKKKVALSLSTIMLLSGLLSACGGGSESKSAGNQSGKANDVLNVSIMTILLTPTPPPDDNPIKQAIEKATNSKMNIQWVSGNSYPDKLNVTLASGDIPDLIYINDPFSPVFRTMVQQGGFWDITDLVKDYPNLSSKISKTAWDLTKMEDGKNYSIPRPRPSEADSFFIIRKDWLDALGMKPPTTTDELYTVLKAFAEKDPDKNGKNDTIPFTANIDPSNSAAPMGSLGHIENSFTGVNGNWKYVDGKMVFAAFLPEEKQAIEFMSKLVKEKLIPEDFASMKGTQVSDLFKAGKAGMIAEKAGTMQNYYPDINKITPTFKDTDFYPLTSINNYNPKGPGFAGTLAIPKTVPEAKMKQILKMVDTWMNDDVFDIQTYGFEGVDHVVKDGVKVVDSKALSEHHGPEFNQIVYVADPYASSTKNFFSKEANELYAKIQDERTKNSVADISTGLYSPTAQQFLPEFIKNMTDLKTKILLGAAPITAWDDYVNKMKNDPNVVKMTQEMTDAYNKRIGK
ncbi:extracellular solute-binding protein [Paenibacillus doosanensis]|uniref:Lipoprotein LipO n=1 Tax=Paenibacillus konkukensis TaxID=2020716 RepID=A0ABY4RIX9_9BACL|nr:MULTISPECIES: extracellular solute-binding protein [Paenibacillus]MCS7464634.1 extracellular solute-binding protein [Paenibacillus doosanensis]UQZ81980.1 Lipoprotein LipO precursor [Paenibacillus konkukensis]